MAFAAVVDVALNAGPDLVTAGSLRARHQLPPRYLERLLHGLAKAKILNGKRGPSGGYKLARERPTITVGQIVRVASALIAEGCGSAAAEL
jgi:Rrf2 family transcriptional regulator, iron-sulfur cluster assembly transcription factor